MELETSVWHSTLLRFRFDDLMLHAHFQWVGRRMKTILFVCTGNVCRSPMAEGLFRHAVKGNQEYRVVSAGVGAVEGQPPSAHAIRALKELGIDISRIACALRSEE